MEEKYHLLVLTLSSILENKGTLIESQDSRSEVKKIFKFEIGHNKYSIVLWLRFGIPNSTEMISLLEQHLDENFLQRSEDLNEGIKVIRYIEKCSIINIASPSIGYGGIITEFKQSTASYNDMQQILPTFFSGN